MCEPTDWAKQLPRVAWSVGALANILKQGSSEREMAECVYAKVRQDLERAAAQWESERAQAKS